jgi:hypothetical protein
MCVKDNSDRGYYFIVDLHIYTLDCSNVLILTSILNGVKRDYRGQC